MRNESGFTIIELLYAVAIAAILAAVGVPSFKASIQNGNMSAASNTLVAALHSARSEAVKRKTRVTVCGSNLDPAPTCGGSEGLAVFVNGSDDMSFDPGTDTLIRLEQWVAANDMTTTANGIPNYVTFTPAGVTRAIGGGIITGSMILCDDRGDRAAKVITITPAGRPAVRKHADVTGAPACP